MHNLQGSTLFNIYNEYKKLGLDCTDLISEPESQEYAASSFCLNGKKIKYRCAKITPKKVGQFVTFWKRTSPTSDIKPYDFSDKFDFLVITTMHNTEVGQFIFPKSVLLQQHILSSLNNEGKRGFRIYPPWDIPLNNQALKTQKWQIPYFIYFNEQTSSKKFIDHLSV